MTKKSTQKIALDLYTSHTQVIHKDLTKQSKKLA